MICTDKYFKEHGPEIITEGFDAGSINPVSYDLTIGSIISEDDEISRHVLRPEEMIFIKTREKIAMPDNLMGRIGEKNSRLRQGLWVSGPHYFPGHNTYIFLRVKNISPNAIGIKAGDNIAQLFLEQLDAVPDMTYNLQAGASFNDEDQYRGLGRYKTEYDVRIKKMEQLE